MRRPSPALIVAFVALVVALGGTAVAAKKTKKYVVTSTKQISPKVLAQLRGRTGPMGPTGLQGPPGVDGTGGPAGADGPPGPSSIVSATRKGPLIVNGTVAELTALPPGEWLIVATLSTYSASDTGTVGCNLSAGSFNAPASEVTIGGTTKAQLTTSATLSLAASANVALTCSPPGPSTSAKTVRLYAIRTGDLDERSLD